MEAKRITDFPTKASENVVANCIFADPLCNKELKLEAAEHISRLSESQGIDQDSSDDVTV